MSAVAGVRGTAFDVVVGADGQTIVQVSEGRVQSIAIKARPWKSHRVVRFAQINGELVRCARLRPAMIGEKFPPRVIVASSKGKA